MLELEKKHESVKQNFEEIEAKYLEAKRQLQETSKEIADEKKKAANIELLKHTFFFRDLPYLKAFPSHSLLPNSETHYEARGGVELKMFGIDKFKG